MKDSKSFGELLIAFDQAMIAAGYTEGSLRNFRSTIRELSLYAEKEGINTYSITVGAAFLQKNYPVECDGRLVHELPCSTQYAMRAIALLNDYYVHGAFLRARRLKGRLQLTPEYERLDAQFGEESRINGVSEATIYRRSSDLRK